MRPGLVSHRCLLPYALCWLCTGAKRVTTYSSIQPPICILGTVLYIHDGKHMHLHLLPAMLVLGRHCSQTVTTQQRLMFHIHVLFRLAATIPRGPSRSRTPPPCSAVFAVDTFSALPLLLVFLPLATPACINKPMSLPDCKQSFRTPGRARHCKTVGEVS